MAFELRSRNKIRSSVKIVLSSIVPNVTIVLNISILVIVIVSVPQIILIISISISIVNKNKTTQGTVVMSFDEPL